MRINADFSQRAAVIADDSQWVHSPESGVDRQMLDRIGDEVARATSIVRYAPGSRFATHQHAKGEEFLVLDGIFSDESGHYPAGSYVRNPPGSAHAPYSEGGCRILVKLRQFDAQDLDQFSVDTTDDNNWPAGSGELPLHAFGDERVRMQRIAAGSQFSIDAAAGGTEVFVVKGELSFDGSVYPGDSWLRFPPGDVVTLQATRDATVWLKSGHLRALLDR